MATQQIQGKPELHENLYRREAKNLWSCVCSLDTWWSHTKPPAITIQSIFRHCPGMPGKSGSSVIFVENDSFPATVSLSQKPLEQRQESVSGPASGPRFWLLEADLGSRPLRPTYHHSVCFHFQKRDGQCRLMTKGQSHF